MTGVAGERIPLFRPLIEPEALTAVQDAFESGWLGLGPRTAEFERAFADYIEALVERLVALARDVGREIATPAQAREMIGLVPAPSESDRSSSASST